MNGFVNRETKLTRSSIKEAIDTIPIGIVFFRTDGIPVLCNRKMYELTHELLGKDLQILSELRNALLHPSDGVVIVHNHEEDLYLFPDETIWKFEEAQICSEEGKYFTQVNAFDYTDLYKHQEELDERNSELREMIHQIQRITENVVEITRQQEILNAKMRLHNKMGSSMLAVKEYLMLSDQKEQKKKLIEMWRSNLQELQEEVGAQDDVDTLQMVIDVAETVGVEIQIDGIIPESFKIQKLLAAALRECVTNTKKHAEGTRILMKLEYLKGEIKASFTNDGKQPTFKVVEGGGLTSLRQSIHDAGGMMHIQSVPCFMLTVTIPLKLQYEEN